MKTVTGVAMPEWLQRNDTENGAWSVQNGPAQRGEAWTSLRQRMMRVPFGGDETNRVIRAHEMMHARVSPMNPLLGTEVGISEGSVRAAEEFRVNQLVKQAGFDTDLLFDGSEKRSGERLAEMKDYQGLVQFIAAIAGTKPAKDFLRGVKSVDPELAKVIREVEKEVVKIWRKDLRECRSHIGRRWGNTQPLLFPTVNGQQVETEGWTIGYHVVTIPIAIMLDQFIAGMEQALEAKDHSDERSAAKAKRLLSGEDGAWATLVFDKDVRLTKSAKGSLGKKRTATNMGRNPRRIGRMLTDPQRRVFDKTYRSTGGIILIDQSGSMSLSINDVEKIMQSSPGCTIIGYSHNPGTVGTPNAWILAENGKRAETVRSGNGGNGVDGPALEFAISKARKGEPIIWVCDGTVTAGSDDGVYENLVSEVVELVRKNKVHMVEDVAEAIDALTKLQNGGTVSTRYTGLVEYSAKKSDYI